MPKSKAKDKGGQRLRRLTRLGVQRGLLGGSRVWTVVGITVMAIRLVRKIAGKEPELVFSERLGPDDALLIAGANRGEPSVERR